MFSPLDDPVTADQLIDTITQLSYRAHTMNLRIIEDSKALDELNNQIAELKEKLLKAYEQKGK